MMTAASSTVASGPTERTCRPLTASRSLIVAMICPPPRDAPARCASVREDSPLSPSQLRLGPQVKWNLDYWLARTEAGRRSATRQHTLRRDGQSSPEQICGVEGDQSRPGTP